MKIRSKPRLNFAVSRNGQLVNALERAESDIALKALANGVTLYEGPSLFDGSPIVVIATGLVKGSSNVKTGPMVQIWIMLRDGTPGENARNGRARGICGTCESQGTWELNAQGETVNVDRKCYVDLGKAPRNVMESFHRGLYPRVTREEAALLLADRETRGGAYGDPGAVPAAFWRDILRFNTKRTAYTHAWKTADIALAEFCMASVDSESEAREAQAMGWRTFRVRTASEALLSYEIACPASPEAGNKTQCIDCLACGGLSAKAKVNIAIIAHGPGMAAFERAKARAIAA